MKRRTFSIGVATTCAILRATNAIAAEERRWVTSFRKLMGMLPNQRLFARLEPAAIYSSKRSLAAKASPDTTPGAALDLWITDEHDFLLLTWHRESSREKRVFICALFLCHHIQALREPLDGRRTDFEAAPKRFTGPEASERLEELDYVKTNARALAKEFHTALSKVLPPEKVAGFAYTAALSDPEYKQLLKDAAAPLKAESPR